MFRTQNSLFLFPASRFYSMGKTRNLGETLASAQVLASVTGNTNKLLQPLTAMEGYSLNTHIKILSDLAKSLLFFLRLLVHLLL